MAACSTPSSSSAIESRALTICRRWRESSRISTEDLRAWRDTTYVMATFVCATLAIGAWLAHRHWASKASQRKYNILEYDDDGDVDGV